MSHVARRLLLVEDDAAVAAALARMLRPMRFAVELAPSVEAAMACVRDGHYDLVLCDVRLGDGDALDVLGAIEQHAPAPAVVVMSGWAGDRVDEAASHACVTTILYKPFGPRALRDAIKRALTPSAGWCA